jgi:Hg(II)-responsive transcriptional regulator
MNRLTIGNLANQANVNVETIRYYERRRLLPEPPRTRAGYRLYHTDTVRLIRFIKHAQELGFSLNEIKELLALRATPGASSADVRKRAEAKLNHIEEKLRVLQEMKNTLMQITKTCPGRGLIGECPILQSLDHEEDS